MLPIGVRGGEVSDGDAIGVRGGRLGERIRGLGQTKVEHLHRPVAADLDVGGLQVAVDEAPASCAASRASAICRAMSNASLKRQRPPG